MDEVLPAQPIRQWVLSVPFRLRFLFAAEPAALVPTPRVHLTRYHGVFAPHRPLGRAIFKWV